MSKCMAFISKAIVSIYLYRYEVLHNANQLFTIPLVKWMLFVNEKFNIFSLQTYCYHEPTKNHTLSGLPTS